MKYARILAEFHATPWAILPDRLSAIAAVLYRAAHGARLDAVEIEAAIGNAPQQAAERRAAAGMAGQGGAVAVLPLYGIISHRIHQVQDISGPGGTSTEGFARAFRAALNDPAVESIVIDVNSPGGNVHGTPELAAEIFAARSQKKIVAVANAMAASAAYWIGSAAQELVVTPSGEVGSIGVWTAHNDLSMFMGNTESQNALPKMTIISAGKYKAEGNPYEPLSDEARAAIQASVDKAYDQFIRDVARHRGIKPADVRDGFGQGRMVDAYAALGAGMVDRVATLDETIARLASGKRLKSGRSVALAAKELEIVSQ